MDAVKANIINGMNGGTGYFVGKDAGFAMLADINAGYDSPHQLVAWYWAGGGIEIAREMYAKQGLYYIGPVLWGAESIPSKTPLKNAAAFKGIKMRSARRHGRGIVAQTWGWRVNATRFGSLHRAGTWQDFRHGLGYSRDE